MKYEVMLDYWGGENLKHWNEATLNEVVLPPACKAFLLDVGLPAPFRRIGPWQLDWDDTLSPHPTKTTRLLGRNYGIPSIWIEQAGRVLWDRPNTDGEWVINSSVEQFGLSLTEFDQFREGKNAYAKLGFPQALLRFQNNIKKIDPDVLTDEGSYWPSKISEMRQMTSS